MLKSHLCDYSDAYILISRLISIEDTSAEAAATNDTNEKVIFKNCAPFTDSIRQINNTQFDNDKHIDIVMPMYNVIVDIVIIIKKTSVNL